MPCAMLLTHPTTKHRVSSIAQHHTLVEPSAACCLLPAVPAFCLLLPSAFYCLLTYLLLLGHNTLSMYFVAGLCSHHVTCLGGTSVDTRFGLLVTLCISPCVRQLVLLTALCMQLYLGTSCATVHPAAGSLDICKGRYARADMQALHWPAAATKHIFLQWPQVCL